MPSNNKLIFLVSKPSEVENPDTGVIDYTSFEAKVILFNDDWHTFDDVIFQLIKAINCTQSRAEAFAMEVHTKGKALVFNGEMPLCLKVSSILEEISLRTQIEC